MAGRRRDLHPQSGIVPEASSFDAPQPRRWIGRPGCSSNSMAPVAEPVSTWLPESCQRLHDVRLRKAPTVAVAGQAPAPSSAASQRPAPRSRTCDCRGAAPAARPRARDSACSRSSASARRSTSPVSSTVCGPARTRSTQERSLSFGSASGPGCNHSNETPSQVQRSPRTQRSVGPSASSARPLATRRSTGKARASDAAPPAWSRSSWLATSRSILRRPRCRRYGSTTSVPVSLPLRKAGPAS